LTEKAKKVYADAKEAKDKMHEMYAELKKVKKEANSSINESPFYEMGPPFVEYISKV